VTDERPPLTDLDDEALLRELDTLARTRVETLRHGSDEAWAHHRSRTDALEAEYLRRRPHREVEPGRLREGARALRQVTPP